MVAVLALTAVLLGAGGCASPHAAARAYQYTTCDWHAAPDSRFRKDVGQPPPRARAFGHATMTLVTNLGTIVVEMDASRTPCAIASFRYLAARHFFDETTCYRLVDLGELQFLECGDPTAIGLGGPGYQFPDESSAAQTRIPAGAVVLAGSGRDTNGSRFQIVARADVPVYTRPVVLGTVTAGLDVVKRVVAGGGDGSGIQNVVGQNPRISTIIRSVRVTYG